MVVEHFSRTCSLGADVTPSLFVMQQALIRGNLKRIHYCSCVDAIFIQAERFIESCDSCASDIEAVYENALGFSNSSSSGKRDELSLVNYVTFFCNLQDYYYVYGDVLRLLDLSRIRKPKLFKKLLLRQAARYIDFDEMIYKLPYREMSRQCTAQREIFNNSMCSVEAALFGDNYCAKKISANLIYNCCLNNNAMCLPWTCVMHGSNGLLVSCVSVAHLLVNEMYL